MAGDARGVQSGPESEASAGEGISHDAKTWAMLCHIAGFAGYVLPFMFGNIIGPLIVWILKKDEYEFVDFHGKESINFQITASIAAVVGFLSLFVLIGFLLLPVVLLFHVIVMVIAAVKASNGQYFRYPVSIRFIK